MRKNLFTTEEILKIMEIKLQTLRTWKRRGKKSISGGIVKLEATEHNAGRGGDLYSYDDIHRFMKEGGLIDKYYIGLYNLKQKYLEMASMKSNFEKEVEKTEKTVAEKPVEEPKTCEEEEILKEFADLLQIEDEKIEENMAEEPVEETKTKEEPVNIPEKEVEKPISTREYWLRQLEDCIEIMRICIRNLRNGA